jgi:hypothetical protein
MFLWNILNGYFQAVAPRWQDATASYPTVLTKSIGGRSKLPQQGISDKTRSP